MADENESERDETDESEADEGAGGEADERDENEDEGGEPEGGEGGEPDAPADAAREAAPDGDDDEADDDPSDAPADDDDRSRSAREERELRREAEQEQREAEQRRDADPGALASMLGLERWVQFAFIALSVASVYLLDNVVTAIWENFAEPDPTIVTITAVVVSLGGAFAAYQNERVRGFSSEVVGELSKVTWPTRDETWYSTIVVLAASAIAAVYTGLFDALWSALTDLVYTI